MNGYRQRLEGALRRGSEPPPFPEGELTHLVTDTWSQAGQRIYRNWLADVSRRGADARSDAAR